MFSAKFLINKSAKGKQILETYKLSRILTKSQKRMITHIVIDEFKDVFGKLTHIELLSRADELGDLFPTESKVIKFRKWFFIRAQLTFLFIDPPFVLLQNVYVLSFQ